MSSGKLGCAASLMKKGGKFNTYDPAEKLTDLQIKIIQLLERPEKLTGWEQGFLKNVYCADRLSKRQVITTIKIFNRLEK